MAEMTGVVTIVQEGRFQLTDDLGRAHLFVLSPHSATETSQLRPLSAQQSRVRVRYEDDATVIAMRAKAVDVVK